nr:uncharacterized protein LOC128706471 isoform X3 [Cherax quadricarinatus]
MISLRSLVRSPAMSATRPLCSLVQNRATYSTSPSQDGTGQQQKQEKQQEEATEVWKQKGRIHSKKSIKVELVGGKRYLWCACGYSKNQVGVKFVPTKQFNNLFDHLLILQYKMVPQVSNSSQLEQLSFL